MFLIEIYSWLIIARVVVSFLPLYNVGEQWKRLLQILYNVTEPLLSIFRNNLPGNMFGIDFSPFLVLLLLFVIRVILIKLFS